MFIPGLGAIIQLRGVNLPPVQDSRIGLAGPIYGLGAAIFCAIVYLVSGAKIWAAIATIGVHDQSVQFNSYLAIEWGARAPFTCPEPAHPVAYSVGRAVD